VRLLLKFFVHISSSYPEQLMCSPVYKTTKSYARPITNANTAQILNHTRLLLPRITIS